MKRFLVITMALIIIFTMTISSFISGFASTDVFSDMPDNWSTEALQNAVANGLLKGDAGKIMPEDNLTRAQMATVINRAFGAKVKASIQNYTDVSPGAWYYDEMAKAVQMKTFQGSGNNLNPEDAITREQAFIVMARALKLEKSNEEPEAFSDLDNISSWAKEEVFSMIKAGYIKGSNGKINPKATITRAEFAQLMYNLIKQYINEEGEYTEVAEGNIMINVSNVTLKNLKVTGDLIIGDGVGDGNVVLDNVEVTGRLIYRNEGEQLGEGTYEIALITDKGNIDDRSFNQGAWEGVVEYAEANDISHTYIKPEEASDAGYLAAIDLAVQGGAEIIVTVGFLFEVPIYEAQTKYPDVKFILLDGSPHTADWSTFETKDNVASIMYAEEESGFLAGYAAIKDGMTGLGFMGGMAVPQVQAFGFGYIQGAEYAAEEMGLDDGAIEIAYHYTGNFEENDTNKVTAKTMYQEGVEVIFACGGSVGISVMSAADEEKAKVIGVDVDQRYDSETVITSAMKGFSASVVGVLTSIYNDSWYQYSGKTIYLTAANDGVGLPTEVIGEEGGDAFDRFENFTKEEYDAVFSELAAGNIEVTRTIEVTADTGYATAEDLTEQLDLQKVIITIR